MRSVAVVGITLLVAVGCATDEEAIAEALATAPTTTAPGTALVSECRDLLGESFVLGEEAASVVGDMSDFLDEVDDGLDIAHTSVIHRFERINDDFARAQSAELQHDSRMVEHCSDVSDADLRAEIAYIGDGLGERARLFLEVMQTCRDDVPLYVECPDVPSMSELLPGAR